MSWNAGRFCHGAEGFLGAAISTAFNAARAARAQDNTGPTAIARLARALRLERRRTLTLEAELLQAYARIRALEGELTLRPRRR